MKKGILLLSVFSIIGTVLINIFATSISGMLNREQEVIVIAADLMHYVSIEYVTIVIIFCLHGFTNGASRTMFTMTNGIISSLVVRIPLAIILHPIIGMAGIGLAIALSPIIPTIIAIIYVGTGSWRKPQPIIVKTMV